MHAKLNPITSEVDEQILHYLLGVRVDAGHEMLRHPDVAVVDLAGTAAAGEDVLKRWSLIIEAILVIPLANKDNFTRLLSFFLA